MRGDGGQQGLLEVGRQGKIGEEQVQQSGRNLAGGSCCSCQVLPCCAGASGAWAGGAGDVQGCTWGAVLLRAQNFLPPRTQHHHVPVMLLMSGGSWDLCVQAGGSGRLRLQPAGLCKTRRGWRAVRCAGGNKNQCCGIWEGKSLVQAEGQVRQGVPGSEH
eukprot:755998-Pelagomonas_calceolata.AAC.8